MTEYSNSNEVLQEAKKRFSRLGIATLAVIGITTVIQLFLLYLLNSVWPKALHHSWGTWLISFLPLYLIAVPIGLLILRKAPAKPPEKRTLKLSVYLAIAIISIFLMYAGNTIGVIVNAILQLLSGVAIENPILEYATDTELPAKVLFMVILAPVIEEYFFRKQLIDRMHPYGEKLSIVVSALIFGLIHGNLSQLFYAFALGLSFGYVYLKTGRLRYSIGLHMLINLMGGVIAPFLLEKITPLLSTESTDLEILMPYLPWLLVYGAYVLALLGISVLGLILLCIYAPRLSFASAVLELPKGARIKTVFLNAGMILLGIGCLALIVFNVIPA